MLAIRSALIAIGVLLAGSGIAACMLDSAGTAQTVAGEGGAAASSGTFVGPGGAGGTAIAGGTGGTDVTGGMGGMGGASSSSAGGDTTASSSSGGPVGPPLHCANAPCMPGEICCHDGDWPTNDHCSSPGGCGGDMELHCAGPANCPGQVCCDVNGQFEIMECRDDCTDDDQIMCEPGVTACPAGDSCEPSQTFGQGYFICK